MAIISLETPDRLGLCLRLCSSPSRLPMTALAADFLPLFFLIALGEFVRAMGDRLPTLDPRALIEAFTDTFRRLEEENRIKGEETEAWLDAGRDRLAGKPPEDEG